MFARLTRHYYIEFGIIADCYGVPDSEMFHVPISEFWDHCVIRSSKTIVGKTNCLRLQVIAVKNVCQKENR